jgi:hypothetical protein
MTERGAPYRTPQGAPPIVDALAPLPPFADGEVLVISTGTVLPRVCVKCGKKRDLVVRDQSFAFDDAPFPGSLGALQRFELLFGATGHRAAAAQTSGNLSLPICQVCDERWKNARMYAGAALGALLVPLAFVLLGMFTREKRLAAEGFILTSLAAMIPIAYVNRVVVSKRTIQCKGIAGRYMKLAGFGEAARKAILGGLDEKPKKRKKKPAA